MPASDRLTLVCFHVLPPAWATVQEWAARHGHRIALVVTTPGPSTRRSDSYKGIVAGAPPELDVLVTTRLRRVARPLIEALQPDLILSFTFPYRIPPEIIGLARLGAVNLHPTVLPAYRGPNPMRAIYDAQPVIGATLHRTEEDFDTGLVYAQAVRPLPEDATFENVVPLWRSAWAEALETGMARYLAGAPGTPQDHSQATYGGAFTPAEFVLDWALPRRTLQCRATALGFYGGARALIDGKELALRRLTPLPDTAPAVAPGIVVSQAEGDLIIRAGDGLVRVTPA